MSHKNRRVLSEYLEYLDADSQPIPIVPIDICLRIYREQNLKRLEPDWQDGCNGFFDSNGMLLLYCVEGDGALAEHGDGSGPRKW